LNLGSLNPDQFDSPDPWDGINPNPSSKLSKLTVKAIQSSLPYERKKEMWASDRLKLV